MDHEPENIADWAFDVEEASAGAYRAQGKDRTGHSVEATGIDPDAVLNECKKKARCIIAQLQQPRQP